jgi:nitrogen fixation/metabolism regulation signal transduction histidine kinase
MEAIHVSIGTNDKRTVTRALRVALIVSVALAVLLLVLLATATANTHRFQARYELLLYATGAIAITLIALVIELTRRLAVRYKRGIFGTRLMARLAWWLILMTAIPGLLLYSVALQFVGRSIESWFDVPLERALESGLMLGRSSLDSQLSELAGKARVIDDELDEVDARNWQQSVDKLRDQSSVAEVLIVTSGGRVMASAGGQYSRLVPEMPSPQTLQQARLMRQYSAVEGGDAPDRPLQLLVIRLLSAGSGSALRTDENRFLILRQPIARAVSNTLEAVNAGYRDYQQLSLSRQSLKNLFRVTLTLALVLTIFAAIAAAFLLSGWLTGPLTSFAAGTRAVAEGDFRPVKDYFGRDELGVLTQSFNAMTRQLEDARNQVQRNQRRIEQARDQLERVLSNLTAAVLVFDADFRLVLLNPGAKTIFGDAIGERIGQRIEQLPRIGRLAAELRNAFVTAQAEAQRTWQRQLKLPAVGEREGADEAGQVLLACGTTLPGVSTEAAQSGAEVDAAPEGGEPGEGFLLVCDDISGVISAQRALAWSEVAQRLAHEIKNPLTPIQLAAERLQHKLVPRLAHADAEVLTKNTTTIVNQVGALKHLVDEFRDYARLPAAKLKPLDLVELIHDIAQLYPGAGGDGGLTLQLGSNLPRVMGDASQMRQVIHNLIKNALEAIDGQEGGLVSVGLESIRARAEGPATAVRLTVRDNGPGFPDSMLSRAFEPYVTTKSRGTGLGLAIVKKIVEDHGARIEISNQKDPQGEVEGATVVVIFTKLSENTDKPPGPVAEQTRPTG